MCSTVLKSQGKWPLLKTIPCSKVLCSGALIERPCYTFLSVCLVDTEMNGKFFLSLENLLFLEVTKTLVNDSMCHFKWKRRAQAAMGAQEEEHLEKPLGVGPEPSHMIGKDWSGFVFLTWGYFLLLVILERTEGRERGTSMWKSNINLLPPVHTLMGDRTCNPGIQPAAFWGTGWHSKSVSHPARAEVLKKIGRIFQQKK